MHCIQTDLHAKNYSDNESHTDEMGLFSLGSGRPACTLPSLDSQLEQ